MKNVPAPAAVAAGAPAVGETTAVTGTETTTTTTDKAKTTTPTLHPRSAKDQATLKAKQAEKKLEEQSQDWKATGNKKRKKLRDTKSKAAASSDFAKLMVDVKELKKSGSQVAELIALLKDQTTTEENKKHKAEENWERKRAKKEKKREERKKKKEAKGKEFKTRHHNKLLDPVPNFNFWANSCDAQDIEEWLWSRHRKETLSEDLLEQIDELKHNEKDMSKAKHWRKLAEPLMKKCHPEMFEGKDNDANSTET